MCECCAWRQRRSEKPGRRFCWKVIRLQRERPAAHVGWHCGVVRCTTSYRVVGPRKGPCEDNRSWHWRAVGLISKGKFVTCPFLADLLLMINLPTVHTPPHDYVCVGLQAPGLFTWWLSAAIYPPCRSRVLNHSDFCWWRGPVALLAAVMAGLVAQEWLQCVCVVPRNEHPSGLRAFPPGTCLVYVCWGGGVSDGPVMMWRAPSGRWPRSAEQGEDRSQMEWEPLVAECETASPGGVGQPWVAITRKPVRKRIYLPWKWYLWKLFTALDSLSYQLCFIIERLCFISLCYVSLNT